MTDYEIIDLRGTLVANRPRPTAAAEIWADMIAETISPALAQIRLAQLTNWPGYVRTPSFANADEGA